jgi:hypothetical protein
MYKKVSGSWTALGSFLADPAVGQVVRLEVAGTTLEYYYDGVLKDTPTASDSLAAGRARYRSRRWGQPRFQHR